MAQDATTARQILLDGLAHDVNLVEILHQLAPMHPRNNTFPDGVAWYGSRTSLSCVSTPRPRPAPITEGHVT
jgi:hypothetical protein